MLCGKQQLKLGRGAGVANAASIHEMQVLDCPMVLHPQSPTVTHTHSTGQHVHYSCTRPQPLLHNTASQKRWCRRHSGATTCTYRFARQYLNSEPGFCASG